MLVVVLGTCFTVKAQTTISLLGSNVVLNFPTASEIASSTLSGVISACHDRNYVTRPA